MICERGSYEGSKLWVLSCSGIFRLPGSHKVVFVLSFSTRKKESYGLHFQSHLLKNIFIHHIPSTLMVYDNFGSNKIYPSTFHQYIWNIFCPSRGGPVVWDPACMHEVLRSSRGGYHAGGGFLASIAPHLLALLKC